jgi:hypothetical protein
MGMASTHLRSFKNQLIKTVTRKVARKFSRRRDCQTAWIKVLLKHWYAKDRRKVPESWEKIDSTSGLFLIVLGFLLSVFSGTQR